MKGFPFSQRVPTSLHSKNLIYYSFLFFAWIKMRKENGVPPIHTFYEKAKLFNLISLPKKYGRQGEEQHVLKIPKIIFSFIF